MAMISLQEAYDQARRWIESDDPERAIGLAQYILEHYPNNLEAYRILGEAYLADRQLDQAQEAFERVLRSDPENVPAHVGLGIAYERQGRLDRAIPAFEKAWEIKPEMAELRSQLLRLYADAWGSEHAQLRLRSGGLARLYAKGHMLPQAIAEFRKVIDDQPDRYDAKVALAEALWRNGQEDEAADLIHKLLKDRPDLLKPNLLLGYMELASGKASGQQYWDAAYDMDPYQTVAHAMFDTLPDSDREEPSLEEWDEAAWRRQREQEQQELAATRPIPVPSEGADAFREAGLDQQAATLPPPPPPRAPMSPADNDDFLAGLLGMGAFGAAEAARPHEADRAEATGAEEDQPVSTEDDTALSPFSLDELGLSDDDFANLDTIGAATASSEAPPAQPDEASSTTTPFSAEEPGLGDARAGLNLGEAGESAPAMEATSSAEQAPPESEDVRSAIESGAIEPFSFADLGLSEDEIAHLDGLQESSEAPAAEAPQPEMTGAAAAEDHAESEAAPAPAAESAEGEEDLRAGIESGKIKPFSFGELGLSDEELATLGLDETQPADQEQTGATTFGDELLRGDTEPAELPVADEPTAGAPPQEEPRAQQPEPEGISEGLASGELQPFSFADLGLSEEEIASLNLGDAEQPAEESQTSATGATSHHGQPSEPESISEGLASGELQPFSFADLGLSEEEIASLNEIGETPEAHVEESAPEATQPVEPEVQPFSLSDLGLSDEEFDNLNELGQVDSETTSATSSFADSTDDDFDLPSDLQPFSLDELDISAPEAGEANIGGGLPTSLQPFSLDEPTESPAPSAKPAQEDSFARLPDEEDEDVTQPGGGYSWQEPHQRSQPRFISSMNKEETGEGMSIFAKLKQRKQEEASEPQQNAPTAEISDELDDRMLFSIDDVSLRDTHGEEPGQSPEPSASAPTESSTVSASQPPADDATSISDAIAAGEIQPFSLSDLGLSEEEIAALGLGGETAAAESAATDAGAPVSEEPPAAEHAEGVAGEAQPFSFADLDVADESAAAPQHEPSEPESISEGLASGELQPFSFADLGLSEEEIASLNLGEAAPTGEAAPHHEPSEPESISEGLASGEIQPFSFADLGLSEEEIASLNLGDAGQPAGEAGEAAPAGGTDDFSFDFDTMDTTSPQASSAEQPSADEDEGLPDVDLQPFSLSDLGLSDDEIDSLGINFSDEEEGRESSLDLTEDDLAGLDFGADQWISAAQEPTPQPGAEQGAHDAVVSRLVALGQQQGYVDISDISDAIRGAEADESRVEEVVQQLQDAHIQIRDGDEVIDLNAEDLGDEQGLASSQTTVDEEPDLTPFSLSELGLSDEEIASLDLDRAESPQLEPAADEAEVAPFSLSDLGLSEEETSASGSEVARPPAAHAPEAQEEPQPPQPASAPSEAMPAAAVPQTGANIRMPSIPGEAAQLSPVLAEYVHQLESDPQNHILRLSVARAVGQAGMSDMSVQQYRYLIRQNALLDVVVDDIRDLIDEIDDPRFLQRLHRLLGDAFVKQGRINEAMDEYKWVAQ